MVPASRPGSCNSNGASASQLVTSTQARLAWVIGTDGSVMGKQGQGAQTQVMVGRTLRRPQRRLARQQQAVAPPVALGQVDPAGKPRDAALVRQRVERAPVQRDFDAQRLLVFAHQQAVAACRMLPGNRAWRIAGAIRAQLVQAPRLAGAGGSGWANRRPRAMPAPVPRAWDRPAAVSPARPTTRRAPAPAAGCWTGGCVRCPASRAARWAPPGRPRPCRARATHRSRCCPGDPGAAHAVRGCRDVPATPACATVRRRPPVRPTPPRRAVPTTAGAP